MGRFLFKGNAQKGVIKKTSTNWPMRTDRPIFQIPKANFKRIQPTVEMKDHNQQIHHRRFNFWNSESLHRHFVCHTGFRSRQKSSFYIKKKMGMMKMTIAASFFLSLLVVERQGQVSAFAPPADVYSGIRCQTSSMALSAAGNNNHNTEISSTRRNILQKGAAALLFGVVSMAPSSQAANAASTIAKNSEDDDDSSSLELPPMGINAGIVGTGYATLASTLFVGNGADETVTSTLIQNAESIEEASNFVLGSSSSSAIESIEEASNLLSQTTTATATTFDAATTTITTANNNVAASFEECGNDILAANTAVVAAANEHSSTTTTTLEKETLSSFSQS